MSTQTVQEVVPATVTEPANPTGTQAGEVQASCDAISTFAHEVRKSAGVNLGIALTEVGKLGFKEQAALMSLKRGQKLTGAAHGIVRASFALESKAAKLEVNASKLASDYADGKKGAMDSPDAIKSGKLLSERRFLTISADSAREISAQQYGNLKARLPKKGIAYLDNNNIRAITPQLLQWVDSIPDGSEFVLTAIFPRFHEIEKDSAGKPLKLREHELSVEHTLKFGNGGVLCTALAYETVNGQRVAPTE